MAQDLPASVDTQIAAQQSRPTMLYELYLDSGTLRYAGANSNIIFPTGGNVYYAKSCQFSNIKISSEGEVARASINFDNVSNDMHYYNALEVFDGKQIIVKKVYRDALSNSTYYREMFNGYMEEPRSVDKQWMTVDINSGSPLQRKMLLYYFQKECNNSFGDTFCNKDGYADLTSLTYTGTVDSGSAEYLIDNALTQADGYWTFGKISITISGHTYERRIESFTAATDRIDFDVSLPESVSNGDSYTIYKGCPKTWDACQSNGVYGPSSDNSANFFGFPKIGKVSYRNI